MRYNLVADEQIGIPTDVQMDSGVLLIKHDTTSRLYTKTA